MFWMFCEYNEDEKPTDNALEFPHEKIRQLLRFDNIIGSSDFLTTKGGG